MMPRAKKAVNMAREELKAANAEYDKGFWKDVPYGASVCNCGDKVVHQGRCQKCWNKYLEKIKQESQEMTADKKRYDKKLEKMSGRNAFDFDIFKKQFRFTNVL